MQSGQSLRPFYPEIKAYKEDWITVSSSLKHKIYVAQYGNPDGIPVLVLHGGPGSGTAPYYAQFFDPKKYHIILADQRGAGKSTPKGEMQKNTTPYLIEDMETIRAFLNIDQWAVFGGSWGSTLALLYAEAHPKRVTGLLLRGIFLARPQDIDAFVKDGCPAALAHPKEWDQFKQDTSALISRAGLPVQVSTDKIYHIYYLLLTYKNDDKKEEATAIREEAAGTISAWEKLNSFLTINPSELVWARSADGVNMGLTEAHYFEHGAFIRPNQVLADIGALKGIPIWMVQGTRDLVCPPDQADELHAALLRVNADNPDLITRFNVLAGHSHKEEAIRDGLIRSSDEMARLLNPEKKMEVIVTESPSASKKKPSPFFPPRVNPMTMTAPLPMQDEKTAAAPRRKEKI
jgi:proline iminopeptidase